MIELQALELVVRPLAKIKTSAADLFNRRKKVRVLHTVNQMSNDGYELNDVLFPQFNDHLGRSSILKFVTCMGI